MSTTEVDLSYIIAQLRKDGVTGRIYYVNPERGNDAFDGQSVEFPFATLGFALSVCVDYRHDAVVCFTNNNSPILFNGGAIGCVVNVATVTIIGVNGIAMDNVFGGATQVLMVDDDHIRITGIRFEMTFSGYGVNLTGVHGCEVDHNTFISSNAGVLCQGSFNNIHDNEMNVQVGATPSGVYVSAPDNRIYNNTIQGSDIAGSFGVRNVATGHRNMIFNNTIERVQYGVFVVVGATNVVVSDNRFKYWLKNSQLTIGNGTGTVTLLDFYGQGVGGIQFHVNCAYAGGPNNSFKTNAAPGSQMSIWVEEYTEQDANWRRITPDAPEYWIRTGDALDVLIVSEMATVNRFRLRAALDAAPTATVDLDVTLIANKEG